MPYDTPPPSPASVSIVTYIVPKRSRETLAAEARDAVTRRGIPPFDWMIRRELHPDGPVVADLIAALHPDLLIGD